MGRLKIEPLIKSVKTLTDQEYLRASEIALKLEYPVNMDTMQILVPFNEMEKAKDNALVRTLQLTYKFSIQSTIV